MIWIENNHFLQAFRLSKVSNLRSGFVNASLEQPDFSREWEGNPMGGPRPPSDRSIEFTPNDNKVRRLMLGL
jgi:hypothetical protein